MGKNSWLHLSFFFRAFKPKRAKAKFLGLRYGIHKHNLAVLGSVEIIDLYLLRLREEGISGTPSMHSWLEFAARLQWASTIVFGKRSIHARKQAPLNRRDEIVTLRSEVSGSIGNRINFRSNLHRIARALLQINWDWTLYDRARL